MAAVKREGAPPTEVTHHIGEGTAKVSSDGGVGTGAGEVTAASAAAMEGYA